MLFNHSFDSNTDFECGCLVNLLIEWFLKVET
jgi:hypothetical protein